MVKGKKKTSEALRDLATLFLIMIERDKKVILSG